MGYLRNDGTAGLCIAVRFLPVVTGKRLSVQEAVGLHGSATLHELGAIAEESVRERFGSRVTYGVDRNINYTNICTVSCAFCAFCEHPGSASGYVLSVEDCVEKVRELQNVGGTHILLQGGHHPDLDLEWACTFIREVRGRTGIHIHGFSPPEITHFARVSGVPVKEAVERLKDAGLGSIPGGGAEILVDAWRGRVSPSKVDVAGWLDVMREAHGLGLNTTATMMYGSGEPIGYRFEHLARIRELQEESISSGRPGRFTAFILWPFSPENTRWGRSRLYPGPTGPTEYLRMVALSRMFLDNVEHLQASWVTQGLEVASLALRYGCDDLGTTMMEENVVSAAGTTFSAVEADLRSVVEGAGLVPRKRDVLYSFQD